MRKTTLKLRQPTVIDIVRWVEETEKQRKEKAGGLGIADLPLDALCREDVDRLRDTAFGHCPILCVGVDMTFLSKFKDDLEQGDLVHINLIDLCRAWYLSGAADLLSIVCQLFAEEGVEIEYEER